MGSQLATQEMQDSMATEVRATEMAEEAEATSIAATEVQATADAVSRESTRTAAIEQAQASATAQAQSMFAIVEGLVEDGHLSRSAGVYHRLPDFDESWAQINYYNIWWTGLSPSDFVIKADVAWDSASSKANWWNSGCGFVFRVNDEGDHYISFFAMDGNVRLFRSLGGKLASIGTSYYGKVDVPKGNAKIMLVVDGGSINFFVNDKRVQNRQDYYEDLSSGRLAYTLVSGTNTGFGTRCQMTNVELWELEPTSD
jgi:hypothetical protein